MSLFGTKIELKAFSALKGKDAKAISKEEIVAVNTELAANDLAGVEVVANGTIATMQAALNTAETDLAEANEANETLTEANATLTAEVKKLKGSAAAESTAEGTKPDVIGAKNDMTSTSMADYVDSKNY